MFYFFVVFKQKSEMIFFLVLLRVDHLVLKLLTAAPVHPGVLFSLVVDMSNTSMLMQRP